MATKDHHQKNLKNPFFRQKKRKKKKKNIVISFLFLLFLSFLVYLFFYSPVFLLKNIEIIGLERTKPYLIKEFVWQSTENRRIFDVDGANLCLYSSNNLKRAIDNRFDFANISVKKKYPKTIEIKLEERQPAFILKINDHLELRDEQACPINNVLVSEEDLKTRPLLEKNNLDQARANDCLNLADAYLTDLFSLFNLSHDYQNFSFDKFILNGESYNLTVVLKEGPKIFFSRREDFIKQLEKLRVICREIEESVLETIDYIDVRYGDKAYINYK